MTKLEAFKLVARKYLYIENDEYIDVVFGTILANRLDAIPVWIYLVGPPGGGKTVILESTNGHSFIYALTTLTDHTLMSGQIQQPNQPDPSLLPKLHGKVLIIKDFTTILSGKMDTAKAIFGQLRDAFDGTSKSTFGTGKETQYTSKFGIIAGVTNVIDRHQHLVSDMGERFLTYRLPAPSVTEVRKRIEMASSITSAAIQTKAICGAAQNVLNLIGRSLDISEDLNQELCQMARFVAIARADVPRDGYTRNILGHADPEIPTRLIKQFVALARGIASVREHTVVERVDIDLVKKVALDCIPRMRLSVFRVLLGSYPNSLQKVDVAEKLRLESGKKMINEHLEDLLTLGIIKRSKKDKGQTTAWDWVMKEEWAGILKKMGCSKKSAIQA